MKKLGMVVTLCLASHALAGSLGSVLPNDLLQGEAVEVSAAPTDLHSCVLAAVTGIDGISKSDIRYDATMDTVSFKTSMPGVFGDVQRRSGEHVWVFIGILSKDNVPAIKAYAAPRVKAIAAAISKTCGHS